MVAMGPTAQVHPAGLRAERTGLQDSLSPRACEHGAGSPGELLLGSWHPQAGARAAGGFEGQRLLNYACAAVCSWAPAGWLEGPLSQSVLPSLHSSCPRAWLDCS